MIRCEHRQKLQQYLSSVGINTLIHYPIPPHKQIAYRGRFDDVHLPITEKIHNEVLSLPMSSVIKESEIDYIIEKLNEFSV